MLQILIPAYNAENYIEETLNGFNSQNYKGDFEVIISIDGDISTLNKLLKIRNNYNFKLKLFNCTKNNGVYKNKNNLLSLSTADDLIIFDSDDIPYNFFISEIMSSDGDLKQFKYDILRSNTIYKQSINDHANGCIYLNRTVLNILGGYQEWSCAADTEFLKRFTFTNLKLTKINKELFIYRHHMKNLTYSIPQKVRNDYHKLFDNKIYKNNELYIKINKVDGIFI